MPARLPGRCFDIDLVVTSDGEVLASHPDDLRAALGPAAAGWGSLREGIRAHTLAEVRAAGADEERVPTVQLVLQVGRRAGGRGRLASGLLERALPRGLGAGGFRGLAGWLPGWLAGVAAGGWRPWKRIFADHRGKLLRPALSLPPVPPFPAPPSLPPIQLLSDLIAEDDEAWEKLPDDYSLLPLLLLELKGAAFAPGALKAIAASASEEKVARHVALFVASDAQLAAARDAGFKGPLARAFMVRAGLGAPGQRLLFQSLLACPALLYAALSPLSCCRCVSSPVMPMPSPLCLLCPPPLSFRTRRTPAPRSAPTRWSPLRCWPPPSA